MVPVVPSCSVKGGMQGDDTWRKLLDAGGSPAGEGRRPRVTARSPHAASPHAAAGVQGLLSPNLDDESVEGKIARVEKRLKKNLPAAARAQLEKELETLRTAQREGKSALSEPGSSNIGEAAERQFRGARRKAGVDTSPQEDGAEGEPPDLDDDEEEVVAVTRKVNRAAPKVQHPQTMARMADWKGELERRIRQQTDMDGRAHTDGRAAGTAPAAPGGIPAFRLPLLGGPGESDSPLGKMHNAIDGLVGDFVNALGLGRQDAEEELCSQQPLPPQTFSRRL